MIDFNFVSPTKIFFGREKEKQIGEICKEFNLKKVLLVIGKGSVKKSGLFDVVTDSLKNSGISYTLLEGVRPNPEITLCRMGIKFAKDNKVDGIIAVGGGSVIDTAKSIAAGFYYGGDPFDFNTNEATPKKALPIGVILTISASGSESSASCVISNDSNNIKQGFNSEVVRPVFAIENPELTYSVSSYQTACGTVDIISHSLERYMNKSDLNNIADEFALGIIKSTVNNGKIAINNPEDYNARANLMINSSLSHSGLTGIGKTNMMAMHKMEHAISALHNNIAHGAGLAVVIPIWLNAVIDFELEKIVNLVNYVFDLNLDYTRENAIISVSKFKDFFKEIGMPTSLTELGIRKDEVVDLVDIMTDYGTRVVGHTVKPLSKDEVMNAMLHYGY